MNERKRQIVAVSDIIFGELQEKLCGKIELKPIYTHGVKKHHIETPLVRSHGGKYRALTHFADILAAKQLGMATMEVELSDTTDEQEYELTLFKSVYNTKDHTVISIAIDTVLDYFNTAAGKKWAATIKGDLEEKLAYLFGTSTSTIKRFRHAGKEWRKELSLVYNGEMTWRELNQRIADAKKAKPKVDANANKTTAPVKVVPAGEKVTNAADSKKLRVAGGKEPSPVFKGESDDLFEDLYVPAYGDTVDVSTSVSSTGVSRFEFTNATFSMGDGSTIEIKSLGTQKELWLNGKKLKARYNFEYSDGSDNIMSHYCTVFTAGMKGDTSIQIIFDNPDKILSEYE